MTVRNRVKELVFVRAADLEANPNNPRIHDQRQRAVLSEALARFGITDAVLGYRMAGFRVAWANEHVPAAQAVYRLNNPTTVLDTRSIRLVKPEDIMGATGMGVGDIDLFDSSPPCDSFSTSGKRERGWGESRDHSGVRQRTDDLSYEFIRLAKACQPKTFVVENVSGLVKGTAKGYFLEILKAMKAAGYAVECRVLDAQWLGVPQARQRTIFVGVRNDIAAKGFGPAHPPPLKYRYSVRDAIPWIARVVSTATGEYHAGRRRGADGDQVMPTVTAGGVGAVSASDIEVEEIASSSEPGGPPAQKRKFTIAELIRICGFPDDFQIVGTFAQKWERLGMAVPPVMMAAVAKVVLNEILIPARAGGVI